MKGIALVFILLTALTANGFELNNKPKVTQDMAIEEYLDFMNGNGFVSAYEQHVEGLDYDDTTQLNIYTIFDYYKMVEEHLLEENQADEKGRLQFFEYTFLDMTGDEIPELILKIGIRHIVITYKKNETAIIWYDSFINGTHTILNNGCMFYEGLTANTWYIYQSLNFDENGIPNPYVTFRIFPNEKTTYEFNGKEITEKEWNTKIEPYFYMKEQEEAQWKRFYIKNTFFYKISSFLNKYHD